MKAELREGTQLSGVECALLVEDAVARLRHDVFNSLAAVRSASYYIQRRVSGSEQWQADPKIAKFFQLISEQLDTAVERIGRDPGTELPHRRQARGFDGAEGVRLAVQRACSRATGLRVESQIASGPVRVDHEELVYAVAATLESLWRAGDELSLTLRAGPSELGYSVWVESRGELGPPPSASSALPQPLALARRAVIAATGQFRAERGDSSWRVELCFPSGASQGAPLLIVDDDHAGRSTLLALLELEGIAVHECASLAEARCRLAVGEPYAVVLLDRKLPDGVGDSLVPELRAALPAAKIVLMTGESHSGVPAGFDAAHQKGLDPTALLDLVQSLLAPTASGK